MLKIEGKLFAIEVKSGRKRHSKGMERFLAKYPDCIPLIIDFDKGKALLKLEYIDSEVLMSFV